ncbi:MAG: NAD(P)-binding domain-containing protein [Patescibacteria group bacterium]
MLQKKVSVGFIGQGFIGKNMADDFVSRGYRVVRYDNEKYIANRDQIRACDFVFIAVPTPSTPRGFDDSILREVLKLVGDGKTAIIKSTIKIGSTEKYQKLYPKKYILHSPEFLRERSAVADTKYPPRNVVGYTQKSKAKAKAVLALLPKAPHNFIVPSREAELVKYMGNNFLFLKVIYANIAYNLAKNTKTDYETVANIVGHDSRIGHGHLAVHHSSGHVDKPGRGAGGHCFIKDMAAFLEMFEESKSSSKQDKMAIDLMKAVVKFNNQLLVDTKKDMDLLAGVYKIKA